MAVPTSELQKINPSNVIELFELQLDSTIHGSTATYRWHNGISENNADIVLDQIVTQDYLLKLMVLLTMGSNCLGLSLEQVI